MSELLTIETLLGMNDVEYLTCDSSIGRVRFQTLDDEELAEFEQGSFDAKGQYDPVKGRGRRRRLLSLTMVDAHGRKLFKTAEHVERAKKIRGPVLRELFAIAARFNRLDETVEGEVKNLEATDDDDSAST